MPEHRLREHFAIPAFAAPAAIASASPAAFVPCPAGLFAAPPAFLAEVYRLAREQAEAQLRRPERTFPPAFSLN